MNSYPASSVHNTPSVFTLVLHGEEGEIHFVVDGQLSGMLCIYERHTIILHCVHHHYMDSPAVDPRSNPGLGSALLMSETISGCILHLQLSLC